MSAFGAPSQSRLGAAALVALLIVSLALGIFVFRARTPDLALEVTSFPKELDEKGLAEITFFVRFDEPGAKVEVVGRDQVIARTLAPSIALNEDEPVTCAWDGLDDDGGKVEPGRYRLRVTLPGQERVMVFPRRLDVQPGAKQGYELVFSEPCVPEGEG
ncbi:MAG TPA: hypothetical protein VD766_01155 [Solirubrobacterales bacterium]|nr:hypothetical protein [Solirubrobacterales bacterium]